ncbi:MAG: hypothetical protein ACERJ2_18400 [Filomicrobium sp.]
MMLSSRHPAIRLATLLIACTAFMLLYILLAKAEATAIIVNLDQKTHKVSVEENNTKREFLLQPNQELTGVCSSDCWIQLEGETETHAIMAADLITIEEGQLFLQEQANSDVGTQDVEPLEDQEPLFSREEIETR